MKVLILNLNGEYFDEIKRGVKPFEYREYKPHWVKKLIDKHYDLVSFRRGYPKTNSEKEVIDKSKVIDLPYRGYELQTITHKHFGNKPIKVFAIRTL